MLAAVSLYRPRPYTGHAVGNDQPAVGDAFDVVSFFLSTHDEFASMIFKVTKWKEGITLWAQKAVD